jgi:hypothetical protein
VSYIFKQIERKVGFLVVDLSWKVFSQTGNIETYLLMKELENAISVQENGQAESEDMSSLDAKL